ncbi:hypothetical protein BG003_004092 [Podila horticola]|nr:hypothetical protein BG003_004092 [Podila horticola]
MGEFEELRKVGTKLSRAAEIELQKKQQQLEYDAIQRKKEDEQARRRKDAETQKLLRMELDRKKMEEEHRKREVAAQLRAKERAREREREQLEREKAIERARKQKLNNPNAPTYSGSNSSRSSNKLTYSGSASGSRSTSSYMDPKASFPVPRKQEFSFDFLQKVAAGGPKAVNGSDDRGRGDRNGSGTASSASSSASRMAAVERLKVNRGYSPERPISNAQALGSKIMKRPPVKRGTGPRSPFPAFRSPGAAVNPIREAGLKAIRDGPIALNTKKRDLRSIEEITADINSHSVDARKEERARRMRAIEDEREKQRLQREKAIQAAKFSRSLMGDNADETDRLRKEIDLGDQNGNKGSSRRGRSLSYSRSPSPTRKKSTSPVRRRRSKSPPTTKRGYSPDPRKRSLSPQPRKRRSPSPIKKKVNRDLDDRDRDRDRDRGRDRDREREREHDRDRDRDRSTGSKQAAKRPGYGGSSKRQVSRSPSPPRKKRAGSPRGNGRKRGPFEEDLSVSSVIGALFGTRYRAKAEDEDLSDDMEARPDEVFREEARSARIARKEDEMEAELERAQAERARKRKLERERNRS